MIEYVKSSIFDSPAQTLVNPVNTVGIMGAGLALEFKKRYPKMYTAYRDLCENGLFSIGTLWIYYDKKNVLNFPTKKHWRHPSELIYIKLGLKEFVNTYENMVITSISFPKLGTGYGGLNWEKEVQPLMEEYLNDLPIKTFIHI